MRSLERFAVVVDSNEYTVGNTWIFPGYRIHVRSLLKFGCDYSIHGQVGQIGVERKSYSDYVRCVGKDWKRFLKQLRKLQRNRIYAVIVEGNIDDPIPLQSRMVHDAVIYRTASVVALGIPILFAGSRTKATLMCIQFMK